MRQYIIADAVTERSYHAFLRQGDMDGACVFYSLMMCLNLCGYVDQDITFAEEIDRRTLIGKFYKQFEDYPALFSGGALIEDLQKIVAKACGKRISTEYCGEKGAKARKFVVSHLLQGHPLVLGVTASDGTQHAVTAAGLEFASDDQDEDSDEGIDGPEKILVLDPGGQDGPCYCLWNSVVCCEPHSRGRYPYLFICSDGEEKEIIFDEALAVWSNED